MMRPARCIGPSLTTPSANRGTCPTWSRVTAWRGLAEARQWHKEDADGA